MHKMLLAKRSLFLFLCFLSGLLGANNNQPFIPFFKTAPLQEIVEQIINTQSFEDAAQSIAGLAQTNAQFRKWIKQNEQAIQKDLIKKLWEIKVEELKRLGLDPQVMIVTKKPITPRVAARIKLFKLAQSGKGNRLAIAALKQELGTIDISGQNGVTPLIMAVKNGHTRMAGLLLSMGAQKRKKDTLDKTALDYAKEKDNNAMISLLQKAKVNPPSKIKAKKGGGRRKNKRIKRDAS